DKEKPALPDFMSVAHYLRPTAGHKLPGYVGVNPIVRYDSFVIAGPAYLGESYAPFAVTGDPDAPDFRVPNVGLAHARAAARGRPGGAWARRARRPEDALRLPPPRHRPLRRAGGPGPLRAAGAGPADQPRGGPRLRPGPRAGPGARALRPQPVGPAAAARPQA